MFASRNALAVPIFLCLFGGAQGLSASAWGQEAPAPAQAQEKARKAPARDMRAELEAMNKQYRDNNPQMDVEFQLRKALERANKAEMRVGELEAKLREVINQNNIDGQAARIQARNAEELAKENARQLAKIQQDQRDREAKDAAALKAEELREANLKESYKQRSRDIVAQNEAQRAAHYAHRPIYGPLVAAPDIPEFTSLKGMVDRLKYYQQEIRLASGNGYRVRDLAQQMNAKLNACVGHEVTWEFKVLRVHPEGETSYGVTASGFITVKPNIDPNDSVYGLGLDLRKIVGPGVNQECLEVGRNISPELARGLTVDDVILVRGTLMVCRMDVNAVVQMNLNKAQMNSPLVVDRCEIVIDSRSAIVAEATLPRGGIAEADKIVRQADAHLEAHGGVNTQSPQTPGSGPKPGSRNWQKENPGLQKMGGVTYMVDDDDYYMEWSGHTVMIHIPPEMKSRYVRPTRRGPNNVIVSGIFKFVGNARGTNVYGGTVNIEKYECVDRLNQP